MRKRILSAEKESEREKGINLHSYKIYEKKILNSTHYQTEIKCLFVIK